jgi:hypothetical protein
MLEKTTRIVSENLARAIDRRSFLKRTGETAFAGIAALAAGHLVPAFASASRSPGIVPRTPSCAPPGPYCNLDGTNEPNGCHGASCFEHLYQGTVYQCRVFYIYQAGCWTTAATGGYWTCCDCECGSPRVTTCGCAQFSSSPAPRPDTPGIGGASA